MISKEIKKEWFTVYDSFLRAAKELHTKGEHLDISLPEVLGAFRAKPEFKIKENTITLYANIFYGGVFYGTIDIYDSILYHLNQNIEWNAEDIMWYLGRDFLNITNWHEWYKIKKKEFIINFNDDVFMSVNTCLYDFEYPKEFNASNLDYKDSFWNEVYYITGGYDYEAFVNDVKEYANSQGLSDVFKYFDLVTYKWKSWSLVNKIVDDENQINLSKVKMPEDIKDKANQVMQYIRDYTYNVYYMAYEYALECEQDEEDYEEEVI